MSVYVDGFVIPIQKDNVQDYKQIATDACRIWMKHGALGYYECLGEDLSPDMSDMGDMRMDQFDTRFNLKEDETVLFSFILYKSRAHRDEVNARVMADPEMGEAPAQMPFQMERMLMGGFESIVSSDEA